MNGELLDVVLGLAIALAIGGLVGVERERHALRYRRSEFGGVRTFPLIALAGALAALATRSLGPGALLAVFVAVAGLIAIRFLREKVEDDATRGLTTEIAALLVFGLGALPFLEGLGLVFRERLVLAGASGTIVMALLALREPLHLFAERVSAEDLYATVRFALLAAVALPLLPSRTFGPYDAFNPFGFGLVVTLIAALSFVGYVAVRVLGARRGVGLTAMFGGLVSSTAVALTFSGRARADAAATRLCAFAVVLASTILYPRVWVELLVIRPALTPALALPLGVMLAVGLIASMLLWRRAGEGGQGDARPRFVNPFTLGQAVRLGLLYATIRFVSAAAYAELGHGGLWWSAILAGLADVDAIAISIGQMHAAGLETEVAVTAIVLATVSNTLVKAAIAWIIGGARLGRLVSFALVLAAAAGLAVSAFV